MVAISAKLSQDLSMCDKIMDIFTEGKTHAHMGACLDDFPLPSIKKGKGLLENDFVCAFNNRSARRMRFGSHI